MNSDLKTISPEQTIPEDAMEKGYKQPFSKELFHVVPKQYDASEVGIVDNGVLPIFYETLEYKGKPTRAFAYLGMPPNRKQGELVPAVVLVHGGGGTAFLEWVELWNRAGYAAIAMDLEGHILDQQSGEYGLTPYSGPQRQQLFDDIHQPIKEQWFYHAVADVILANNVLRNMDGVDASKIGVVGISWGGFITSYVAGIDNRFAFAIPIYGSGYQDEGTGYWSEGVRANPLKQYWDSKNTLSEARMPMLWINSDHDAHFSIHSFSKSYEASLLNNKNTRMSIDPGMSHSHQAGWAQQEAYLFANSIVREAPPLIEVSSCNILAGKLNVTIEEHRPLRSAVVRYRTRSDIQQDQGEDATPVWHELEVTSKLKDGNLVLDVPVDAAALYINFIDEGKSITSTPLMKVE